MIIESLEHALCHSVSVTRSTLVNSDVSCKCEY